MSNRKPSKTIYMPWDNKSPIYIWLVVSTPLKNMKVSWDDDIPNMENNPNGSKPPTRLLIVLTHPIFTKLRWKRKCSKWKGNARWNRRTTGERITPGPHRTFKDISTSHQGQRPQDRPAIDTRKGARPKTTSTFLPKGHTQKTSKVQRPYHLPQLSTQ